MPASGKPNSAKVGRRRLSSPSVLLSLRGLGFVQLAVSGRGTMRKLTTGLVAVAVLLGAGLISKRAEAVTPLPELKHQSLVEEVRWRPRPVFRPVRRTARAITRPVRRVTRPVGRIVRPWRW
jgi:hypothetical protein